MESVHPAAPSWSVGEENAPSKEADSSDAATVFDGAERFCSQSTRFSSSGVWAATGADEASAPEECDLAVQRAESEEEEIFAPVGRSASLGQTAVNALTRDGLSASLSGEDRKGVEEINLGVRLPFASQGGLARRSESVECFFPSRAETRPPRRSSPLRVSLRPLVEGSVFEFDANECSSLALLVSRKQRRPSLASASAASLSPVEEGEEAAAPLALSASRSSSCPQQKPLLAQLPSPTEVSTPQSVILSEGCTSAVVYLDFAPVPTAESARLLALARRSGSKGRELELITEALADAGSSSESLDFDGETREPSGGASAGAGLAQQGKPQRLVRPLPPLLRFSRVISDGWREMRELDVQEGERGLWVLGWRDLVSRVFPSWKLLSSPAVRLLQESVSLSSWTFFFELAPSLQKGPLKQVLLKAVFGGDESFSSAGRGGRRPRESLLWGRKALGHFHALRADLEDEHDALKRMRLLQSPPQEAGKEEAALRKSRREVAEGRGVFQVKASKPRSVKNDALLCLSSIGGIYVEILKLVDGLAAFLFSAQSAAPSLEIGKSLSERSRQLEEQRRYFHKAIARLEAFSSSLPQLQKAAASVEERNATVSRLALLGEARAQQLVRRWSLTEVQLQQRLSRRVAALIVDDCNHLEALRDICIQVVTSCALEDSGGAESLSLPTTAREQSESKPQAALRDLESGVLNRVGLKDETALPLFVLSLLLDAEEPAAAALAWIEARDPRVFSWIDGAERSLQQGSAEGVSQDKGLAPFPEDLRPLLRRRLQKLRAKTAEILMGEEPSEAAGCTDGEEADWRFRRLEKNSFSLRAAEKKRAGEKGEEAREEDSVESVRSCSEASSTDKDEIKLGDWPRSSAESRRRRGRGCQRGPSAQRVSAQRSSSAAESENSGRGDCCTSAAKKVERGFGEKASSSERAERQAARGRGGEVAEGFESIVSEAETEMEGSCRSSSVLSSERRTERGRRLSTPREKKAAPLSLALPFDAEEEDILREIKLQDALLEAQRRRLRSLASAEEEEKEKEKDPKSGNAATGPPGSPAHASAESLSNSEKTPFFPETQQRVLLSPRHDACPAAAAGEDERRSWIRRVPSPLNPPRGASPWPLQQSKRTSPEAPRCRSRGIGSPFLSTQLLADPRIRVFSASPPKSSPNFRANRARSPPSVAEDALLGMAEAADLKAQLMEATEAARILEQQLRGSASVDADFSARASGVEVSSETKGPLTHSQELERLSLLREKRDLEEMMKRVEFGLQRLQKEPSLQGRPLAQREPEGRERDGKDARDKSFCRRFSSSASISPPPLVSKKAALSAKAKAPAYASLRHRQPTACSLARGRRSAVSEAKATETQRREQPSPPEGLVSQITHALFRADEASLQRRLLDDVFAAATPEASSERAPSSSEGEAPVVVEEATSASSQEPPQKQQNSAASPSQRALRVLDKLVERLDGEERSVFGEDQTQGEDLASAALDALLKAAAEEEGFFPKDERNSFFQPEGSAAGEEAESGASCELVSYRQQLQGKRDAGGAAKAKESSVSSASNNLTLRSSLGASSVSLVGGSRNKEATDKKTTASSCSAPGEKKLRVYTRAVLDILERDKQHPQRRRRQTTSTNAAPPRAKCSDAAGTSSPRAVFSREAPVGLNEKAGEAGEVASAALMALEFAAREFSASAESSSWLSSEPASSPPPASRLAASLHRKQQPSGKARLEEGGSAKSVVQSLSRAARKEGAAASASRIPRPSQRSLPSGAEAAASRGAGNSDKNPQNPEAPLPSAAAEAGRPASPPRGIEKVGVERVKETASAENFRGQGEEERVVEPVGRNRRRESSQQNQRQGRPPPPAQNLSKTELLRERRQKVLEMAARQRRLAASRKNKGSAEPFPEGGGAGDGESRSERKADGAGPPPSRSSLKVRDLPPRATGGSGDFLKKGEAFAGATLTTCVSTNSAESAEDAQAGKSLASRSERLVQLPSHEELRPRARADPSEAVKRAQLRLRQNKEKFRALSLRMRSPHARTRQEILKRRDARLSAFIARQLRPLDSPRGDGASRVDFEGVEVKLSSRQKARWLAGEESALVEERRGSYGEKTDARRVLMDRGVGEAAPPPSWRGWQTASDALCERPPSPQVLQRFSEVESLPPSPRAPCTSAAQSVLSTNKNFPLATATAVGSRAEETSAGKSQRQTTLKRAFEVEARIASLLGEEGRTASRATAAPSPSPLPSKPKLEVEAKIPEGEAEDEAALSTARSVQTPRGAEQQGPCVKAVSLDALLSRLRREAQIAGLKACAAVSPEGKDGALLLSEAALPQPSPRSFVDSAKSLKLPSLAASAATERESLDSPPRDCTPRGSIFRGAAASLSESARLSRVCTPREGEASLSAERASPGGSLQRVGLSRESAALALRSLQSQRRVSLAVEKDALCSAEEFRRRETESLVQAAASLREFELRGERE